MAENREKMRKTNKEAFVWTPSQRKKRKNYRSSTYKFTFIYGCARLITTEQKLYNAYQRHAIRNRTPIKINIKMED